MPWGEYTLLSGFLDSNIGKLQLKTVSAQVVLPQVAQMKTWRKFAKLIRKTNEVPFQSLWAGYASHMEYVSKF
jgi:hypothetical protein